MARTFLAVVAIIFDALALLLILLTFIFGKLVGPGAIAAGVFAGLLVLNVVAVALGAWGRPRLRRDDAATIFS